jgi:hypothetical protein
LSSFLNYIAGFVAGFLLGAVNWWALYKLYKMLFLRKSEKFSSTEKIRLVFLLLLKAFIIFAAFYIAIVFLRVDAIFLILGLTVSLIGMIIIVHRTNISAA